MVHEKGGDRCVMRGCVASSVITYWLGLLVLSACRGFHPYFSTAPVPPSQLDVVFAIIGNS